MADINIERLWERMDKHTKSLVKPINNKNSALRRKLRKYRIRKLKRLLYVKKLDKLKTIRDRLVARPHYVNTTCSLCDAKTPVSTRYWGAPKCGHCRALPRFFLSLLKSGNFLSSLERYSDKRRALLEFLQIAYMMSPPHNKNRGLVGKPRVEIPNDRKSFGISTLYWDFDTSVLRIGHIKRFIHYVDKFFKTCNLAGVRRFQVMSQTTLPIWCCLECRSNVIKSPCTAWLCIDCCPVYCDKCKGHQRDCQCDDF